MNPHSTFAGLAVAIAALVLTACGGDDAPAEGAGTPGAPGAEPPVGTAIGNCNVANFQADALAQVNAFRAQPRVCGGATHPAVPALTWDDRLTQASFAHSTDMATKNFFGHTGSDGRSSSQRVAATGYTWTSVAENIAAGYPTMANVMAGWQASSAHCKNLMAPNVTQLGLSCVKGVNAQYPTYWTMTLAKPG